MVSELTFNEKKLTTNNSISEGVKSDQLKLDDPIETDGWAKLIDRSKKLFQNSYFKFVLKKAAFYVFVFWVTVSIAFLIPRLLPGDPLASLLIPPPSLTDPEAIAIWMEQKERLKAYLNLDKSLWQQYLFFWRDFLQGNLGYSYNAELTPVIEIIGPRLIYSLVIVIPVVAASFLLGNYVGAWAGYKQSKPSMISYYILVFLQSAPYFWTAYIFQYIFVIRGSVRTVPPSMYVSFFDILKMFLLIFIVMTLCFSGGWATGARSMMIYETESDYILYCRKLGYDNSKLRKYALRNAMLPQLTGLNLRFNECLGATFIVEFVFSWPGLGWTTIEAMTSLNYTLMIGAFVVNIIIVIFGNFFIDILYGFIDPRIRVTGGNE